MITWSRKRTLIAGVSLILLSNAVALIGAAYNRSTPPDSVLRLTQREVHPSYRSWSKENSGIALSVQWRLPTRARTDPDEPMVSYGPYGGSPIWLDQAKLRELGFDVSQSIDGERGHRFYTRQLPKAVFVVLELDGPAYQTALRTVREYAARQEAQRAADPGKKESENRARRGRELLEQEEQTNSRLFVVDAGLDAAALRAKYPDRSRYAIVRGSVRPMLAWDNKNSALSGLVSELNLEEINVPKRFRTSFTGRGREYEVRAPSAYEVTIAFGQRLEPWITEVAAQRAK